uniref:Large ribosomal subunit protein bL9c n=1 Tax=Dasyclonium flaccidum TaxID=2007274 RepID=A0A1Z1MLH4_9FLOR|nr:ribosomal protein L9 [Dasyclonium flaccidum]ARW66709.1 ribosomal protein L9 [Dasyclonium flaccidum]
MKRKIDIILIKDHVNVGSKGTIKSVSPGYAFNYLIPNSIAEIATKNKIKHLKIFKNILDKQKEKSIIEGNRLKAKLEYINRISIYRKVGENYLIFGSINEKDIISYIVKYLGNKLDKKQIRMTNIKQISSNKVEINIKDHISLVIQLNVLPVNV